MLVDQPTLLLYLQALCDYLILLLRDLLGIHLANFLDFFYVSLAIFDCLFVL